MARRTRETEGRAAPTPLAWRAWEDGHREALERQWGRAAPTPPLAGEGGHREVLENLIWVF